MGNCFSYSPPLDDLIGIFTFLSSKSYIQNLRENLKALTREMEFLRATQHEVQNKVAREVETCRRQEREVVTVWLKHFQKVELEFNDLRNASPNELQRLCLCDLWSTNVCASYDYGKNVFVLLEDVKKLKSEGNFEAVTEPTLRSGVEKMPIQPTIGQEKMLEESWKRLMEDEVGIMGLHGMGGVGKTTLFKKIHNKFTEMAGEFRVIWVVVSKVIVISKIQEDVAKQLQIYDKEWTNKIESDKAKEIHKLLQRKKFILMLDDIWEEVDLVTIGVPSPNKENGCKVAFTTRSLEVCGQMGAHESMQVHCLESEEAWELFKKNVGVEKLRNDPEISKLAGKVAEKCGGLPLALNVIGKTMASRTSILDWKSALDILNRSAAKFSGIGNKILSVLKYSYDSLENEHSRSCFLYCALFPENSNIFKEQLIEYWIYEGFLGELQDTKSAMNAGYEILSTLIRASLLMENQSTLFVGMHDVLREMALWIASDLGKQKNNFFVQAGVGLCKVPELKDWGAVKRISLMQNAIEEITCSSKFSELTTLLLQNNNLKNLPAEFIQYMQNLVVLDLSGNRNFSELPEQISELVSLQFLNLSSTSIKQLPDGFQKLKKLIHLNLWHTSRLCSISGISKLSSLRILELQESNVHGDITLLKELQHLEHLQILNITISTQLGLEQILCDQRMSKCINGLHILGFQQEPFNISLLVRMENLKYLTLENSQVSEIITDMKSKESTSPCFSNLSWVEIRKCSSIKDLTWLLFAPNVFYLKIEDSEEVEEIINKEKATNLTGITTPFQKLELLELTNLPKLESIYWIPLPFPVLIGLIAKECQKLIKFPLNASSAPRLNNFQIELSSRERISDSKPDELSDSKPDELSDSKPDELSDSNPDELSDSNPDELSDSNPDELSDSNPDELSESKADELSDSKPDELSDSKADELSDSKPEELSDSKPDELSDTAWDEEDIYLLASTTVPDNLEWENEDTKNRFFPLIMNAAIGQTILSLGLGSGTV